MNVNKNLKLLLSDAYELEGELTELIQKCFKEIFKDQATYAYSLFEEDLVTGREYNGCLQGLEYYKNRVAESNKHMQEYLEKKKGEQTCD